LEELVAQRVNLRKPLQYILGTQPFGELDIITRPPVLIPRWETEEWTLKIVDNLNANINKFKAQYQRKFRILDVCSGSGCIALTFAAMLPRDTCEVVGLDNAQHAISLSQLNKGLLSEKLSNPVKFQLMDILDDSTLTKVVQDGAYDLIVSNPPYITRDEYRTLSPEVKLWEDPNALVADDDGMLFHKRLASLSSQLSTKIKVPSIPRLAMEIGGKHQVEPMVAFLKAHHFESVQVWADLAGRDRVIAAQ
ncbi:S-adenosyl-L-methionine-dependent methyltransferase, partial [Basidiobolus meristosporus CBS 931.73]